MSDLAKKLRDEAAILPHELYSVLNPILIEAADEIERLRAALTEIAAYDDKLASQSAAEGRGYGTFDEPGSVQIARRALEQTTQQQGQRG